MYLPSRSNYFAHRFSWDWILLLALVGVFAFGTLVLYAAADQSWAKMQAHLIRGGLAFITLFIVSQIPPVWFRLSAPWLYLGSLILLALVLIMGDVGKGAQRWLLIGSFRFQPSEVMKLALPMMLAWLLAQSKLPPPWPRVLLAFGLIALPSALIILEPDLGTAILIATSGFFILFFAGFRWRWILAILITIAAAAPFIWDHLYDYQKQRVYTFLDPERDPLGKGYHIIQSKIAIGSGGILAKAG